ncbi:TadE/TadG family type IV pilus assembly protein [Streptomyces hoynatensis]|uniref:Pilus assembly protein n=1 Tax=Streptomyces hoynatensis TaxID=1141874 RepID=A0A3A9ZF66_9ACTN|nr:TadE/TadG family type IV pilus assembly protein [Streptomyces hoynatensis]RKN46980.1 pilus assembly protein [Streptomyces hoynatensis]
MTQRRSPAPGRFRAPGARPRRPRRPRGRLLPRGERGSVVVEFAGLFPLILVMMAVIWQCILIGYTFSLAGNAADEGARAAAGAEGDAAAACAAAAREHIPGSWDVDVSCPLVGHVRRANVDVHVPVLFPGAFNLPVTISGSAGAAEEG